VDLGVLGGAKRLFLVIRLRGAYVVLLLRGLLRAGVLLLGVLGVGLLRGAGLLEFPNKAPFTIGLVFLGPFGFGPFSGDLSADPLLGIGGSFSQPGIPPLGPV
jgi:hypothetical protein